MRNYFNIKNTLTIKNIGDINENDSNTFLDIFSYIIISNICSDDLKQYCNF